MTTEAETALADASVEDGAVSAAARFRERAWIVENRAERSIEARLTEPTASGRPDIALAGVLPPLYPEWLGDRSFQEVHGVRFPYCCGPMANGIASARLVVAAARAGFLAFFGAAGLSPATVEANLGRIASDLAGLGEKARFGSNLIHSPHEPDLEEAIVDLYLKLGVHTVDASAFMDLTPAVVRYAVTGLRRSPEGRVVRRTRVLAKISRPEVARRFLEPPPEAILARLVDGRKISSAEANIAKTLPLVEDVTVESDSGGHTDNRPLGSLFPVIAALRDQIARERGYTTKIRIGAAGGLGTPASVAAAFALGAAYVMTGTVNEAAIESGLSAPGRRLLAQADIADVMMAPAADMFEMGVKVQVLRRGSMFGARAQRLYEAYTAHDSLEAMPPGVRARLESDIFRTPLATIWAETKGFWERRDAREVAKAERDPKHRMALCFRWYLGKSSRWAIEGDPSRTMDYQIWCGPAMGAFNAWAKGTSLEDPEKREVAQIGLNFLEGAAQITRAHQLRSYGVAVPATALHYRPRPLRIEA
jgi:PfaD family protein